MAMHGQGEAAEEAMDGMGGRGGMGGMGGGPGPVPSAAPSPDAVVDTAMQEQQARIDAVVAMTPEPEEAYKPRLIMDLADAINAFAAGVAGADAESLPKVVWTPPEGVTTFDAPLPREVWVPIYVINEAIKAAGFGKKHGYDPMDAAKNGGLRVIAAKLERAAKDKKLAETLRGEAAEGEPAGEPGEPKQVPGPSAADEEALMSAAGSPHSAM